MKRKLIFSAVSIIIFSLALRGQTKEELIELFDQGQYFFFRGDFKEAAYYYHKLIEARPDNANFNFKLGEAYLNMPGKEHLAIPYFEKSLKYIKPKKSYNKRSFDETGAPLHAYFYLGNSYRVNNQLDKALEAYSKFIDSPYFHRNYNENIVEREILSCERAKIIQDAPLDLEIIKAGIEINTEFDEERPVVSGDGNTLVFIRRLKFYDALFFTRKDNDQWQTAININQQVLSDGDYYPTGLSFDGKTLLLIRREDEVSNIYYSEFDGNIWSKAKRFDNSINSMANEVHASFGPGDSTIYISSDRRGGRGGYDLYVSRLASSGKWSKPKNLGKQINTPLNEQNAYFCIDNEVLFFSSQAHYTMGGYDIFYTRKKDHKWQVPLNLGYPLNNTGDNLSFSPLTQNCREGYKAEAGVSGDSDIYFIIIKSNNTLNFQEYASDK